MTAPEAVGNAAGADLQNALQRSEQQYRALLGSVADLVCSVRKDGVVLEFHPPKDAPHISARNIVGKRLMEVLPIQIGQQAMHYLEKAIRTRQTQVFSSPYVISEKTRDFEARITPSGPGEAVAVVRDVTARNLSEKEILEISNREQVRIGQDLHDGLGQHLTGVTFLTRALENKLASRSLPEAEEAAEIGRLVLQALSQTRNLARGLFPVELDSNELAPALRELAVTVEKVCGIACILEGESKLAVGDRTVVNHLFRLAQEAINNSVKHGKAKRVVIGLKSVPGNVVLSIRDDGVGFTPPPPHVKGLGLRIMNYRAQKIGGSFDIRRGEDAGTLVTCSLPLAETCKEPGR
jgi:signal transduction histidine kinase